MSETKRFSLGAVLGVTTDRLLSDIGDLYGILGWMTDDSPFTHQIPRFSQECKPWLLRWFPELSQADGYLVDLDVLLKGDDKEKAVKQWLKALIAGGMKAVYDVPRIPKDDHERKHPLHELAEMRGSSDGIVVVTVPDEGADG